MTTSDERRAAGRDAQGRLWPATLKGPTGQFPAAKLAPDYYDHVQQSAFGEILHDHRRTVGRVGPARGAARAPGRDAERGDHASGDPHDVSIYAGVPAAGSVIRVAADVLGTD